MQRSLQLLATALALALPCGIAQAQSPQSLDPVQVQGKTFRVDVRKTCPDIQQSLNDSLASAYMNSGREGTFTVSFTLDRNQVSAIQARGDSREYRGPIRRAVSRLECSDGMSASAPQHFAFVLAIRHEGEREPGYAAMRIPTAADLSD